ncbi:MAG: hypothetical protein NC095_08320 [Muribaculum sp.]|nr:hypothetical protein [Muribaculum sp.]
MVDYSTLCVDQLTQAGFYPSQKWMIRKGLSVSENGKTYMLPIVPAKNSAVYQIDGDVIADGRKCDKLVVIIDNQDHASIFVELKGKDITHAIDQLESTLTHKYFKQNQCNWRNIRARVVTGGSGPTSSASKVVTDAKIRFLKKYHCDLRILKSNQPDMPL